MYKLPEDLLNKLTFIAAAYPTQEACGVVDSEGIIHTIENTSKTPATAFIFHKRQYFNTLREIKYAGKKILFFFHTHPSGSTEPSNADLLWASRTKYPSLIVTTQAYRRVD